MCNRPGSISITNKIRDTIPNRACPCGGHFIKIGFDRNGNRRLRCKKCRKSISTKVDIGSFREQMDIELYKIVIKSFREGNSIKETARNIADVDVDSIRRIIKKFSIDLDKYPCGCGRVITHQSWCWFRLNKSPNKEENIRKLFANLAIRWEKGVGIRGGKGRDRTKPSRNRYTKRIPNKTKVSEFYPFNSVDELVLHVNKMVPKVWDEEVRREVCQNILVDIVSGLLELSTLTRELVNNYKKTYFKFTNYYKQVSIDTPLNAEGYTLKDILEG